MFSSAKRLYLLDDIIMLGEIQQQNDNFSRHGGTCLLIPVLREIEAGRSEIQNQPRLDSEFETCLGDMRLCRKKNINQGEKEMTFV